jgi:tight adherence protein B
MTTLVITILAVFVGTAALCAWAGFALVSPRTANALGRLTKFQGDKQAEMVTAGLLKEEMIQEGANTLRDLWLTFGFSPLMFSHWLRQAELPLRARWLWVASGLCSLALVVAGYLLHAPVSSLPLVAIVGGVVPLAYVMWRRKRRLTTFSSQLPDALELMASALRSGNTVQSSMQVIVEEMLPPLSKEFEAASESIKLGISVEQALQELVERVPNPDLEFFVTAVAMQRSTGGDLAEILDKISWLVRERMYIQAQVQALTGEGRMSGLVLMALPVLLFIVVYALNPTYVMLLFTEPLGRKMLIGAIVLQVLGAIAIRRIVNIKI